MKKKVSTKNYIIFIGIIVLMISACFAFHNLHGAYKENKLSTSPLAIKEVLYDDLKNATTELDADTFLVISYVYDEGVYNNELEIKKTLSEHNLIENVTYLNVTNNSGEDFLASLNKTLGLKKSLKIKKFPAVLYYKNGKAAHMIDSRDHLINAEDFESIIDEYEIDPQEKK